MAPDRELTYVDLPAQVGRVLRTLRDAGHEAALVGGVVRDRLRGESMRASDDWDAASSARPEEVAALFDDATWENRFGTVTIRGEPTVEVTSYRTEGGYRDHRRSPQQQGRGVERRETGRAFVSGFRGFVRGAVLFQDFSPGRTG